MRLSHAVICWSFLLSYHDTCCGTDVVSRRKENGFGTVGGNQDSARTPAGEPRSYWSTTRKEGPQLKLPSTPFCYVWAGSSTPPHTSEALGKLGFNT
eukprot:1144908-Pelagomonas_calceolata.AAC.16